MISCSLALAGSAMAQQDEASPQPKKKHPKGEQLPAQEAHPAQPHPAQEAHPAQPHPAHEAQPANEPRPMQNRRAMRKQRAETNPTAETKAASDLSTPAPANEMRNHGKNAAGTHHERPIKEQNAPNEPGSPAVATAPGTKAGAKAKKPDPQVVQRVKTEHANFKAQPKPEKVPAVTFDQSYRISGAQQWQGPHYEVFRTYQPTWHDQGWYRSHYPRVAIIAGGAYYFNAGFWFPAWGYDSSNQYYAYDAPIYVGSRAEPPDRVIADVHSILQD